MPKLPMDYSNTIFYKIYCIDPSINELYIGHTTNFVQRKHAHKQACNNVKSPNYKCKLYQVMRENSGWDNWKMDIIAFHECDNLLGAKIQEQKYYEEYKATLNSIEPLPKPKPKIIKNVVKKEKNIFYCNKCNIHFNSSKAQDVHNTTKKHIKNSAIDNGEIKNALMPKNAEKCQIYRCTPCDFKCYTHSNYTSHLSTRKHKIMTNDDDTPQRKLLKFNCTVCNFTCSNKQDYTRHLNTTKHKIMTTDDAKNSTEYMCSCGKKYKYRQGLSFHKKKCNGIEENKVVNQEPNEKKTTGIEIDKETLIQMLLKNQDIMENVISKNQEVMEKMMEIMHNTGNNSHDLSSK